ncbi:MAG: hypothetical protein AAGF12_02235 [Myxococcota bacterium]
MRLFVLLSAVLTASLPVASLPVASLPVASVSTAEAQGRSLLAPVGDEADVYEPGPVRAILVGGVRTSGTTKVSSMVELGGPEIELDTAFEAGIGIEAAGFDYFTVGGRFTVVSWEVELEDDDDRANVFALSFVPRARIPLGPVELYGSIILGLLVSLGPDIPGFDLGLGDGYHIDLVAGIGATPLPGIGFFIEGGWSSHWFSHRVDATIPDVGATQLPIDFRSQQFMVRGGLTFDPG